MIRKGTLQDITAIMAMTKACAKAMIANGIYQWNEHYPNKEAFIKDVNRQPVERDSVYNELNDYSQIEFV